MESIGIAARFSAINAHNLMHALDHSLFAPFLGEQPHLPLARRFIVTWVFLYFGSLLVYFTFASLDYLLYFVLLKHRLHKPGYVESLDVRREIITSVKALVTMSLMSTPAEVALQLGYGRVYSDAAQYGYVYLIISPILFIVFSDCMIYFVHRALHHRLLYSRIHKPHHSFINTSPFAAFAFHPVDGYMQGFAYQLFVFMLPFHCTIHLVSLVAVSMWTINIHDRVMFGIPGVNGAGHHTIHHITFKSNYGQYFTLWDKLCGTFKDPRLWKKDGSPTFTEKQVYGKDA